MNIKKHFSLVPDRVQHEQFWLSISNRNHWLVKMRFWAVVLMVSLVTGIYILKHFYSAFSFNPEQILMIAAIVLIYNLFFIKISGILKHRLEEFPRFNDYLDNYNFHSLHFALLQIICDFLALLYFIHYVGGVETPLYVFFIFHVIIGSLILPGPIIYLIVTFTLFATVSGAVLELKGVVTHYSLNIFPISYYNNTEYLWIFFILFGVSLYLSTYLANSIAKELYIRENKLTKAYQDLENAEKAKTRYVMTVVHDLKTPIAAATTYLDMILTGNMGEISNIMQMPLERSKLRLTNAITTINDILFISQLKLESGIENIEQVNIVEIFNEIVKDMAVIMESKNLTLETNYNESDIFNIQAEPKMLKMSLSNLLSNSVKYTEKDGKICIKLDETKENITISVADNGIGIPGKDQSKIFSNFFRSSLSKEKGIEGTGLGLSFVAEVVKKYHGKIQLTSPSYLKSEGRNGTEILISIPKIFTMLT